MSPATAYLLYFVFALGGIGVYFLMPQGGRPKRAVAAVFGVSALVALLLVLGTRVVSPDAPAGYFYLFATVAVLAAARVVTHPRPVYSALYFVLVVVAVAALLVLQGAEFLAIALVIIYAGAILVTYLFVIMLAQQSSVPTYDTRAREPFLAVLAGFVLMAAVAGRAGDLPSPAERATVPVAQPEGGEPVRSAPEGNTAAIGVALVTKYVIVLELSGVLLLVAMIGAIALARKCVPVEGYRPPPQPLGKVGKEVAPF